MISSLGGLDPEVAEAAAYAHDVGNPPFGHAGEAELDRLLLEDQNSSGGFEGNAQTFRILTRLEQHRRSDSGKGLGLSRATLRATLKYPWLRETDKEQRPTETLRGKKWGAYEEDKEALDFALLASVEHANRDEFTQRRSLEAEIMDWADDVTYAIHDLEDFFRAGLIPLDRARDEADKWIGAILKRRPDLDKDLAEAEWYLLLGLLPEDPFDGSSEQVRSLAGFRSDQITYLLGGIELDRDLGTFRIDPHKRTRAELLKQLTWIHVIDRPGLVSQQIGQRRIIKDLFDFYCADAARGLEKCQLLPPKYRDAAYFESQTASRIAADFVSSLTEPEAYVLHQRLSGHTPGSLRDLILGS